LIGGDPSLWHGATFLAGDTPIRRMNSLGGEPKDLGQALTVGLLLIQAQWALTDERRKVVTLRRAWLVLMLSMLCTLSTSAIFMWLVGTAVQVFAYPALARGMTFHLARRRASGVWGAMLFLAALYLIVPKDLGQGITLTDLAAGRTVERLELEDFDQAISQFLIHEPEWAMLGVGLGNAHLYADKYLTDETAAYAVGTAFRAKMGLLRILSELGVLGLVLWVSGVVAQLLRLKRALARLPRATLPDDTSSLGATVFLVGLTLLSAYLVISGAEEALYVTLGISGALTAWMLGRSQSGHRPRETVPR
jgi:hypothetical protein